MCVCESKYWPRLFLGLSPSLRSGRTNNGQSANLGAVLGISQLLIHCRLGAWCSLSDFNVNPTRFFLSKKWPISINVKVRHLPRWTSIVQLSKKCLKLLLFIFLFFLFPFCGMAANCPSVPAVHTRVSSPPNKTISSETNKYSHEANCFPNPTIDLCSTSTSNYIQKS